jgi:trimethylamine--corrinoid protein Co-methyltransferase
METKRNIAFGVLDPEKIARIHEASLELLARVGTRVGGARALAAYREAGCEADAHGLVKIPRRAVERALELAPRELTLYNRAGQAAMSVTPANPVYFGCHADMLQIVDMAEGRARDFLKADIAAMCRLADALPNIHFVLSVGLTKDVNPAIQTQISFIETLKHFSKTINFSTNDVDSLQEVIDMAALVAGGHRELAAKPFIFNYCEPIPPLTHPQESTEKLFISAANRIPVVYMPYCMMGGTAPMSFAATLAQCNAEVLAGLVLAQQAADGAPFIYGAMPSIMDMKTTIGSYGAVEFHLLVAAAAELADHYGLPFYGTAGCTDAKLLDEQAVCEATFQIFATLLSKANIVHDIGVSDHCNSVNPALVVLCDEIIEMLKHFSQGVAVDPDDLQLDLIAQVGPGGAYLNQAHTMRNFRKIYYSKLFSRKMTNPEHSEIGDKLKARMAAIQADHRVPPLEQGLLRELDQWTQRLERR